MKILIALFELLLGFTLGLALLELTLRANPALLLRGMAVPAPVDAPLTVDEYDVHLSDADLYYWSPELMRPVPAGHDRLEAHVYFVADEFGFPNPAPLPPETDVVVLGRSFSLGANAADPWPRLLAEQTGWAVLNLSQTGPGIELKTDYLVRFGLLRRPRWVVVEILPSMDIVGHAPVEPWLIEQLPFPAVQSIARRWRPPPAAQPSPAGIYPLAVDISGRTTELTFFYFYLSTLTVDRETLAASRQWADFTARLAELAQAAEEHSACVALLYAPTKEEIYFSLAGSPAQLEPALARVTAYRLDSAGRLTADAERRPVVSTMQANTGAGRDLMAAFAQEQHLPLADPTEAMRQAVLAGDDPFMAYDTHWSAAGHALVAQAVAETLASAACP